MEKGSTFILRLPIVAAGGAVSSGDATRVSIREAHEPEPEETGKGRKATLLLVEDNEDFRFYLKDNLRTRYHILEAANGKEGWGKIQAQKPDLVVSDIMMPEMDGISLAKRIKSDSDTAHIPVILLTARADEEQQLEGYGTGANDYITKPFNVEILQARIRNLLAQKKHAEVNLSPMTITPLDEQFLKQAVATIEQRLSDTNFSVEDLSRALHISRVTLYKKLSHLTGKSPLDFIRHIRLKRAAELLARSQLTVAEVAYEVGFNSPKYFARYFKQEYGVQPSTFKRGG
jgi:YesN/AraC family two-component response regulator